MGQNTAKSNIRSRNWNRFNWSSRRLSFRHVKQGMQPVREAKAVLSYPEALA
jgi:hypothetical protein